MRNAYIPHNPHSTDVLKTFVDRVGPDRVACLVTSDDNNAVVARGLLTTLPSYSHIIEIR